MWVLWKWQLFLFSVNSPSKLQEKGITYWCLAASPWLNQLHLFSHSLRLLNSPSLWTVWGTGCEVQYLWVWMPSVSGPPSTLTTPHSFGIILSSPVHMLVSYVLYYSCMSTRRQNDYPFISPTHSLLSFLLPTWFPPILLSCHVDGSSPAPSKYTCTSCQRFEHPLKRCFTLSHSTDCPWCLVSLQIPFIEIDTVHAQWMC